jgi:hypothetical protein
MWVTAGRNPRSATWSASSMTAISTVSTRAAWRPIKSRSRPGVATTTSSQRARSAARSTCRRRPCSPAGRVPARPARVPRDNQPRATARAARPREMRATAAQPRQSARAGPYDPRCRIAHCVGDSVRLESGYLVRGSLACRITRETSVPSLAGLGFGVCFGLRTSRPRLFFPAIGHSGVRQ